MAYSDDFRSSYDDGSEGVGDLLSMSLQGSYTQDGDNKKGADGKGDKDGVKTHMTEAEMRKKFPYKVHSYAGYQDNQYGLSDNADAEKNKAHQQQSSQPQDRKFSESVKNRLQSSANPNSNNTSQLNMSSLVTATPRQSSTYMDASASMDPLQTASTGRHSNAMSVATARILEYKRAIEEARAAERRELLCELPLGGATSPLTPAINGIMATAPLVSVVRETRSLLSQVHLQPESTPPHQMQLIDPEQRRSPTASSSAMNKAAESYHAFLAAKTVATKRQLAAEQVARTPIRVETSRVSHDLCDNK